MNKVEKSINTDNLPKRKDGKIDWNSCERLYVNFKFNDIEDKLLIKKRLDNKKLLIEYNQRTKEIIPSKLLEVQLSDLLEHKHYKQRFEIGHKFISDKGDEMVVFDFYKKGSQRWYSILCQKCNHTYNRPEYAVEGSHCPSCDNTTSIRVDENNCIAATDPDIANLLVNEEDAYNYTMSTGEKLEWRCEFCNNIHPFKLPPRQIKKAGRRVPCESCGDGFSYPNRFMYNILSELNEDFKPEKVFEWSDGKQYDFYLPQKNMIIEMHGIQHYEEQHRTSLKEQQENDLYKKELAKNNGIAVYIEIDCRYSSPSYIFENIKKSKLNLLLELEKLDIAEIDKKCNIPYLEKIIELLNKDLYPEEISQEMKIGLSTVYKYLHRLDDTGRLKIDWEKYKKTQRQKITNKNIQRDSQPFICNENNIAFSSYKIGEEMSLQSPIGKKLYRSNVCTSIKENKSYNGFTFTKITKIQFNEHKRLYPDLTFGDFFNIEQEVPA